MTTLQTVLGFDTSNKAKLRFHVLSVFYASGWKGVRLAFPHLSRSTLYRWKKVYEDAGKRLNSLIPKSTRPRQTRVMQVSLPVFSLIKTLREQYPRMGKAKIKLFVDAFCQKESLPTFSESKIGKIIKRNNLFYAGRIQGKKSRLSQIKRKRIKLCPQLKDVKPGYLQVDGFKFYYLEKYYYFLTAVEIVSKQAWVRLIPRLNSKQAELFLKEILLTSHYPIHTLQTDNGSEFKKYFEEAAKEAKLTHLFSYPKHPKTQGFVERFNWTVQDEFLFSFEDLLLHPEDFHEELDKWVVYYNQVRPHQSLCYLTPYQYYQKDTKKEDCLKSM
jgi:hypothetical protein